MKKRLPIGVSEFSAVIEGNGYYVDKTLLIYDWLQTINGSVTLITRPRRFGKTLNMTMLRDFFDLSKDSRLLFTDLAIMQTETCTEMNQWPVIFLSFKDCKGTYEGAMTCIYKTFLEALTSIDQNNLSGIEKSLFTKMIDVLLAFDFDKKAIIQDAIFVLSKLLFQAYGKKVIILIDEYDTPLISAYEQGYYDAVHGFFSSLYSTALKDNPYLERAMLTGIHRIAKENIFSGLNNLIVCTVLDQAYAQYFGLTPEETEALLKDYGLPLSAAVKAMYDGYRFGGQDIYNPWSIINYADTAKLAPYWANTAANDLLMQAVLASDQRTQKSFEQLLAEGQAMVPVDLQTSFFELKQTASLWGLFLNSGYLTVPSLPEADDLQCAVSIPNQEVMTSFRKIIERYGGFAANSLDDLFGALQRRDIADFQAVYEQIILTCTSFYDGPAENAYHMLFLGMCVYLDRDYHVRSNIESGHGRADILLEAKVPGKPNFIFEFKQGEDTKRLAQEALQQIHQKRYYANLRGETLLLGIAHDLKHCAIVSETIHMD